jgi:hypothetical protein
MTRPRRVLTYPVLTYLEVFENAGRWTVLWRDVCAGTQILGTYQTPQEADAAATQFSIDLRLPIKRRLKVKPGSRRRIEFLKRQRRIEERTRRKAGCQP